MKKLLFVVLICVFGLAVPMLRDVSAESKGRWETLRMRVTAYCPCERCCGEWADGVTACGHRIKDGDHFVAADRRYDFGTKMLIEGYNGGKEIEVLDRGGAIKGNKLDVFFHTHQAALEWGVRYIDVKIFIPRG